MLCYTVQRRFLTRFSFVFLDSRSRLDCLQQCLSWGYPSARARMARNRPSTFLYYHPSCHGYIGSLLGSRRVSSYFGWTNGSLSPREARLYLKSLLTVSPRSESTRIVWWLLIYRIIICQDYCTKEKIVFSSRIPGRPKMHLHGMLHLMLVREIDGRERAIPQKLRRPRDGAGLDAVHMLHGQGRFAIHLDFGRDVVLSAHRAETSESA